MSFILKLPLWVIEKGLKNWNEYQLNYAFEGFWEAYHFEKEKGLHVQDCWEKAEML